MNRKQFELNILDCCISDLNSYFTAENINGCKVYRKDKIDKIINALSALKKINENNYGVRIGN